MCVRLNREKWGRSPMGTRGQSPRPHPVLFLGLSLLTLSCMPDGQARNEAKTTVRARTPRSPNPSQ
jgi:hypothetical protein